MKEFALAIALFMPSYDELLDEATEKFSPENFPIGTFDEVVPEEIGLNATQVPHQAIEVQPAIVSVPEPTQTNRVVNVEATFYTARCEGCIGITKTGDDVRNTIYANGYRVIAVDPQVIPLRSIVRVRLSDGTSFDAIASDTGGYIRRNRIDVLVSTEREAFALGRQSATVEIITEGGR